jgi:hypothetical protein
MDVPEKADWRLILSPAHGCVHLPRMHKEALFLYNTVLFIRKCSVHPQWQLFRGAVSEDAVWGTGQGRHADMNLGNTSYSSFLCRFLRCFTILASQNSHCCKEIRAEPFPRLLTSETCHQDIWQNASALRISWTQLGNLGPRMSLVTASLLGTGATMQKDR